MHIARRKEAGANRDRACAERLRGSKGGGKMAGRSHTKDSHEGREWRGSG